MKQNDILVITSVLAIGAVELSHTRTDISPLICKAVMVPYLIAVLYWAIELMDRQWKDMWSDKG